MRNIIFTLISASIFTANFSLAQVCGTYEGSLERQIQKYPDFYQSLENKDVEIKKQYEEALNKMTSLKTENGKKIIPVVVHVIYDDIGVNLSLDQIQNGLDALNRNINGQDDNFLDILPSGSPVTPDIFAAVRGDLNVEFRLAKLDPLGNPTSGVVRVKSDLANLTVTETLSRDRVKALSYWNSYQYLNIWAVRSMPANSVTGDPGLNGYAQFPNTGRMSTDGVVIRSGELNSSASTTLVHEVGHWLNLRHTWGDSDCGDDGIKDTPPDKEGDFDFNILTDNFPYRVGNIGIGAGCLADSLNWAGEMYMNYMDYQNDLCGSMFTIGQNTAMNEILEGVYNEETNQSSIGFREYMWSQENLVVTGTTDGYKSASCSKKLDFSSNGATLICENEQVVLTGNKTNFENVSSFVWDFGDGTINSSGADLVSHNYNSVGSFDVTLTVEYDEIMEIRSSDSNLLPSDAASYGSELVSHMVQGTYLELVAIGAGNITEIQIDSLGIYFGMVDSSFFRGYIDKVIYTATFNTSCSDTLTRNNFVDVGAVTAESSDNSYLYSFEDESDLNGDWVLGQSTNIENQWSLNSGSNTVWRWENGVADDGVSSIRVNGEDMLVGASTEIVSKAYDLTTLTTPAIKFSWSGAAVNYFPVNELLVKYSNDCGEDWNILGSLDGFEISNVGLYASSFKPVDNSEWNNIVMSKPQLKNSNIRFKFEYVVNGRSNNFFLDNIKIGEQESLMIDSNDSNTANARLSLFPNPGPDPKTGSSTIVLENIFDKNVQVILVNILGAEVSKLFSGKVESSRYNVYADLTQVKKGVYFVKVVSNDEVIITDRLIVK
jgi:hypothetical protein